MFGIGITIDVAWRSCRPQGVNTDLFIKQITDFLENLKVNQIISSYKINEVDNQGLYPNGISTMGISGNISQECNKLITEEIETIFNNLQQKPLSEQDDYISATK